jgi:hypothetical protein
MADYEISKSDMAMIYLSPDPYFDTFKQSIDTRHFDLTKHATAGLSLHESDGRLHLGTMLPSTPTTKMKDWQTRVKGAWLIKIRNTTVTTIDEVKLAFKLMQESGSTSRILLFTHPEVRPNLTHDGIPIISSAPFSQATHNQLNNRWEFSTVTEHLKSCRTIPTTLESGGVRNVVTKIMKLTRGHLLKGSDWDEWQESKYLQLNQYNKQGMFGIPTHVENDATIFHLVWTYNIKALDLWKKA